MRHVFASIIIVAFAYSAVATAQQQTPAVKAEPKKNMSAEPTVEGQKAVKAKLAELDKFKGEPKFHEMGFGRGGPYFKWLDSVQELRKSDEAAQFSFLERVSLGDLIEMGMKYKDSKGAETKYTKFAREEINKVLKAEPKKK